MNPRGNGKYFILISGGGINKMPKTKQVRKQKRSSKRKQTLSALNTLGPLPARYITKHKFSQTIGLTLARSYQYDMRLNSVYDPDHTSLTGRQPYGFDQLAALYNRYRVVKVNYVINGIQPDSPGTNVRICAQPSNSLITYGANDISQMAESPRTKFVVQGAVGSPLKTLKGSIYLPSLTGRTMAQYMADDRYSSDVTTNPAETCFLHVMAANMSDQGTAVNCLITLEYVVEWFDINQLPGSA